MGNNRRFGIKHIWAESGWKRVVLRILLSDRSQRVYKHRLDIKETFCYNGVTNEGSPGLAAFGGALRDFHISFKVFECMEVS